MIDVTHQISTVDRAVGTRVLPAGEARTVVIARTYDAPVDDVWDACTNPERIPRWFLPVEGDLRLGGRYRLEGNAEGTVERCDPPTAFDATWEFGGEVSWIELRLSADGRERTRFELTHIVGLTLHLASGGAVVDPAEVAAWSASDAGVGFDDERWAEFGPGAVGIGWDHGPLRRGMARCPPGCGHRPGRRRGAVGRPHHRVLHGRARGGRRPPGLRFRGVPIGQTGTRFTMSSAPADRRDPWRCPTTSSSSRPASRTPGAGAPTTSRARSTSSTPPPCCGAWPPPARAR